MITAAATTTTAIIIIITTTTTIIITTPTTTIVTITPGDTLSLLYTDTNALDTSFLRSLSTKDAGQAG